MANRNFKRVQALENEVKILSGIIRVVGAASAANNTVTVPAGLGFTAARTNTGEYTITLDDSYPELLACNINLKAATAIDLVPQIESYDVTTNKTIVFNACAGATQTDTANGVTHEFHVTIHLKNSTI